MLAVERARISLELLALAVTPQEAWKMVVCVNLAEISVKQIESLPVGIAAGVFESQTPLANCRGRVPFRSQQLVNRLFRVRQRMLSGKIPLRGFALVLAFLRIAIITNVSMSGVFTGHQSET